jgi:hypothetical protein
MSKVFISYRREGGVDMAGRISDRLCANNIKTFFDMDSMTLGNFNTQIYDNIDECTHFLLVLPPRALDRCVDSEDWVRKEIVRAIQTNKIIIPLLMEGFEFSEVNLPDDIKIVAQQQGYRINSQYFDYIMKEIISKLGSQQTITVLDVIKDCTESDIMTATPTQEDMNQAMGKSAINTFIKQLINRFRDEPMEIRSLFEKDKFALLLLNNLCEAKSVDFTAAMYDFDIDDFKNCVNYVNKSKSHLDFTESKLYEYALSRIAHPTSYEEKEYWGGVILFTAYITTLFTVKDFNR